MPLPNCAIASSLLPSYRRPSELLPRRGYIFFNPTLGILCGVMQHTSELLPRRGYLSLTPHWEPYVGSGMASPRRTSERFAKRGQGRRILSPKTQKFWFDNATKKPQSVHRNCLITTQHVLIMFYYTSYVLFTKNFFSRQ